MIVDAIFWIIEAVVNGFASLFPTSYDWELSAWLSEVTSMLGGLNYFLPIAEVFGLVVGVLVVFPFFVGSTLTLWVWSQVRGSSSRG